MSNAKLKELCTKIADDAVHDATNFDGKAFTGTNVGQYLGYHGTAIVALANIVNLLIDKINTLENE